MILVGEFEEGKTILVRNIAPAANVVQLSKFFSFIGPVTLLKVYFEEGNLQSRFCLAQFSKEEHIAPALKLHGTQMLGENLDISLANEANIPSISHSMPIETGGLNAATSPTGAVGYSGNSPALPGALRLPSRFPPLTPEQSDEVSRTVYVGNVNSEVTPELLQRTFEVCGKITYSRLAGDGTHPSRFAFIEFATKEAAQAALKMNGQMLIDRPLKVNTSKNPIVKTPSITPREEEAIQRRLRRAAERIERRVKDREKKDRSPSRSPSRSRSPRRHRSRHHRSSRSRSSRSRSSHRRHQHHSRSRSPRGHRNRHERRSSRSHSRRDKDRSRSSRDRDRSSRDRDRDRDRDRSSRHRSSRHKHRSSSRDRSESRNGSKQRNNSSSRKRQRSASLSPPNDSKKHKASDDRDTEQNKN